MEFKNRILQRAYQHFAFDPEAADLALPYVKIYGGGPENFFLGRKHIRSYEQYSLTGPLLFSLIRCAPQQITSAFLDLQAQFFTHEIRGPGNECKLHKHDYFELTYVVDGQMDLMVEDTRHRLFPGDAYIINANTRHVELRTAEYTAIYLGIKPDYFQSSPSRQYDETPQVLRSFLLRNRHGSNQIEYLIFSPLESFGRMPDHDRFTNYFFTLFSELLDRDTKYDILCHVYIHRIFSVLQNPAAYICSNTRSQMATGNPIFEQAVRYLNDNRRKVPRKELEEALRYNGNYINRIFHKQTGQSLAEYIRDICMSEAAYLLLNSDMNVKDICRKVGYENKTVFYNLFKKKYGVTPQQYRQYEKDRSPS